MTTPIFPKHDPAVPEFWNLRFDAAFTPWDQGAVPQCLQTYVDQRAGGAAPTVLIPGCGSAREVGYLASRGWDVSAIDFSPVAVAQAQKMLGALAGLVREADFFGPEVARTQFDIVYERAFLCALPRRMWPQWAARVAALVRPGGYLTGFFFTDDNDKGPPFGLRDGELEDMLTTHFTRRQKCLPADSIAVFAGKESWQLWERNR